MGNLPSTVSCDPATPASIPTSIYSISGRIFAPKCQFDTTGPVLSITSASFYNCIISCGANQACQAISWNSGTCYQKSSTGQLIASSGVSSFVTSTSSAPTCPVWDGRTYSNTGGDFTIKCGIDYAGIGDTGSSSQPTFQSCIDTCSTTSGCVSVVYSGDACYLKNAIGPGTPNANVQTAVKVGTTATSPSTPDTNPAPANIPSCPADHGKEFTSGTTTFSIRCDADYFGGDLTSTQTNSFAECISACDANEQCIDVSYVSGACYLKSRLTTLASTVGVWTAVQEDVVSNSADTSPAPSTGTLSVSCPSTSSVEYTSQALSKDTPFDISCGTDYYGGDFLSTEADSLQACIDTCASHSECVGLSYCGVGCYLKSTLNTPTVDPASNVIGAKVVVDQASPSSTTTTTSAAPTTTNATTATITSTASSTSTSVSTTLSTVTTSTTTTTTSSSPNPTVS